MIVPSSCYGIWQIFSMYCAIIYHTYKELRTPSAQEENSHMKRKARIITNH